MTGHIKVCGDIGDFILGIQIKRNPNSGTKTTYTWLTFSLYIIHDNSRWPHKNYHYTPTAMIQ
jgi:hypothetical protein